MWIVCGLAAPTDGSLKLFGSDNLEQQRYKMGCTIENPALYPAMTAQENMEVYRIALGIQDQQIIPDLLEFVGLHELGRKKTKDFSLGMKQRLMIAIALLGRPELLILDEPMNGLDPTGIIEVRELLLKLNRERHLTIIISSHILEELSKIATHYGVIHKGKMVDEFTAAELEQRCRKELKFVVSDPKSAAHLIQAAVTDHFEISSSNEIILHDCLDQAGRINRLLLESDVEVSAIIPGEQGLEDYFTIRYWREGSMNMVKAEFYKLKKSKPFWICLCVCIFMAALLPFALSQAVASGEPDVQDLSLSAVEITSYAFSMPILTLVAAVFTSIFVSGEFTHGTMKNYVSKGFNRTKLFGAKFLACAVAVTLMMVVFVPVILLSGTIFLGFDPHGVFSLSAFIGMLLAVWLLMMAYTAVFTAIGMTLRSNGASIGVNICLVSIFPTLLSAADFIFKRIGFQISTGWIDANLSAVATLTPASGALLTGVLVGCVWLLLGVIGGTGMFRRQDIK